MRKIAWTTGKDGSKRKELYRSPRARNVQRVLADGSRTVIGTSDNVPEPTSAMTWRAKKGFLEVMTGRTWPGPGLSHKARNTRIRIAEISAGLCGGQVRSQRGHTSKYTGTTEVRVLLRYDFDIQG